MAVFGLFLLQGLLKHVPSAGRSVAQLHVYSAPLIHRIRCIFHCLLRIVSFRSLMTVEQLSLKIEGPVAHMQAHAGRTEHADVASSGP